MANSVKFDLLLTGGTVMTPNGTEQLKVGISQGKIAALGELNNEDAEKLIDCTGLHILPGVIDSQVHFREPGAEHKEDLASGTLAAIAGGVTAIFEMPNTNPSTSTESALLDKLNRAHGRAWCDYAFFVGATGNNAEQLASLENMPGCSGVKIFMGASTGNLLVSEDAPLENILRHGNRRISVHAEDEPRMQQRKHLAGNDVANHPLVRDAKSALLATQRMLNLVHKTGRPVHILHVTTEDEIPLLAANKELVTMEVTPQHLTLNAPDCYQQLGSFAQMNPPIRELQHQKALWHAVNAGIVDVIGSDHAPHTKDEKSKKYPESPSGMPGVQTLVPLMLNHVNDGKLSLQRFVDLTSAGPQRVFGIAGKGRIAVGYDADFTIVDLKQKRNIESSWLKSKCGWSPYTGMKIRGWPTHTIIRGNLVMQEDEIFTHPVGEKIKFVPTLKNNVSAA